MRKEIGRFEANADDGQQFTIFEYQEDVDVGTLEDPPATDPDAIELFTLDGERVMFKYEGTYEIISSGLIVHRVPYTLRGRVCRHRTLMRTKILERAVWTFLQER